MNLALASAYRLMAPVAIGLTTQAAIAITDGTAPIPVEYKWALPICTQVLLAIVIMLDRVLGEIECREKYARLYGVVDAVSSVADRAQTKVRETLHSVAAQEDDP